MHAFQVRRPFVSLAFALATLLFSLSAGSAEDPRERAAMLAATAEKILNTSTAYESVGQAERLIEEALALDPGSGHAMVEKGRAILVSRAAYDGNPRAAQAAEALFTRASQLDPPYGRGFVLLGHLYTMQGRLDEASIALNTAERWVPNDPWLKLNWGAYFVAKGHPERQAAMAEAAIATGTTNPGALMMAYSIVQNSEVRKGNRAKADEIHSKIVRLHRGQQEDAWVRGNYARDVLFYFADFEAGEKLAREALEIMDYGHARQSLSLALYGKWAQAAKDGRPLSEQEALFQAAHANDPGGRQLPECAMRSKRAGFVFEAVAKKGIERQSLQRC